MVDVGWGGGVIIVSSNSDIRFLSRWSLGNQLLYKVKICITRGELRKMTLGCGNIRLVGVIPTDRVRL